MINGDTVGPEPARKGREKPSERDKETVGEGGASYLVHSGDDYSEFPALLVVGAGGNLAGLHDAQSVRLFEKGDLAEAAAHIPQMIRMDILWIVIGALDDEATLASIFHAAAVHDAEIICETRLDILDRINRLIPTSLVVQWLVDADETDRRLALASARSVRRVAVYDTARDPAMERIDRLQDEVARISRLLGQLAGEGPAIGGLGSYDIRDNGLSGTPDQVRTMPRSFRPMPREWYRDPSDSARDNAKRVRAWIRKRRAREHFFPSDLFADPAWDMLLDLYAARLEGQMVSVSSLCIAAAVPATTALRWIKTLTDSGLFEREADDKDGRRIFIAMSDKAFASMEQYFQSACE